MNKKDEKDKKSHLSIQMNEKLNEYLDEFIKNNGLKKSRLIEKLLKNYISSKSLSDDEVQRVGDVLCRVAQLIQGWNTSDSDSAWSDWDKSVYNEVIELQKYIQENRKK